MATQAAASKQRQVRNDNIKRMASRIILWTFLVVIATAVLFPVIIAILGSFKTNAELTTGATIFPSTWRFSNYAEAWTGANFARYTWNSLFVGIMTTVGTLLIASMAAVAVDRLDFVGKRLFVTIQASTMFISIGAVVLRPQFELMIKLNLYSSLWGVIIILISSHASVFFILLSFMKAIPRELDEAAKIDGASFFKTYYRILLPLLTPGLGVVALFTFRGAWNEYILPQVFTMNQPNLQTLTVGLASLRHGVSAAAQTHIMMAGACLSIIPLLVVYVFTNKSFMQMNVGSVKG